MIDVKATLNEAKERMEMAAMFQSLGLIYMCLWVLIIYNQEECRTAGS